MASTSWLSRLNVSATLISVDGAGVRRELEVSDMGIQIFESVVQALRAGYTIESPIPDSEGFVSARIHTSSGWSKALVRVSH